MSFWKYIFDSEWSQRRDIEELKSAQIRRSQQASRVARSSAARQSSKIEKLQGQIEDLEDTVGEMALYLKSLVTLVERNGGLTQEDLLATMKETDAADGSADGKTTL